MSAKLKVLLTGACGRIGPYMVEGFREAYDLRTFDIRTPGGVADHVTGDLQDRAALDRAMAAVEVVVHLAATSDEAPFVEQLVPNNVVGLYNTFEAARAAGVRRIVYASTIQTVVYYPQDYTVQITDPPRPMTLYAVTKVMGEAMGRWYHDKHGLEFVGVRIGAFQPYDSPLLRENRGFQNVWLSPRDCVSLFRRAVETPGIGYGQVFATSKTPHEFASLAPAKELLDWEPADDVADYVPPQPG